MPNDRVVLVIEDNVAFARVMFDQVRALGFKCLVAVNGEGGVALANEYQPEAITLDLGLPDVDGWIVLEDRTARLLLVEDNVVEREAIAALLGNGDVVVTSVATGLEAWRLLQSTMFDCIGRERTPDESAQLALRTSAILVKNVTSVE